MIRLNPGGDGCRVREVGAGRSGGGRDAIGGFGARETSEGTAPRCARAVRTVDIGSSLASRLQTQTLFGRFLSSARSAGKTSALRVNTVNP